MAKIAGYEDIGPITYSTREIKLSKPKEGEPGLHDLMAHLQGREFPDDFSDKDKIIANDLLWWGETPYEIPEKVMEWVTQVKKDEQSP